jgi:hypothetical protein
MLSYVSCYALFVIDGCDLHTQDGFPDTSSGTGLKGIAYAMSSVFPCFFRGKRDCLCIAAVSIGAYAPFGILSQNNTSACF